MTTDGLARQIVEGQISDRAARVARDAADLAKDLERLAKNPTGGISTGLPDRIAQRAMGIAIDGARLAGMREVANLLPEGDTK